MTIYLCLDTGVWIKLLVIEELALYLAARRLLARALATGRLILPAFAWAEVGSVLRKKIRQGAVTPDEAAAQWSRFGDLPIEFTDSAALRSRAWEIARQYALPTLYDAAFLACAEVTAATPQATVEFWTTDEALLRSLGSNRPPYMRLLTSQSA